MRIVPIQTHNWLVSGIFTVLPAGWFARCGRKYNHFPKYPR